ncbi:MAG: T9SS type A sorting domain-containing protein, partial [Cytophagaceae bacterium]
FFFNLNLKAQCLYGFFETDENIELWEYNETNFNAIRKISDDGDTYGLRHDFVVRASNNTLISSGFLYGSTDPILIIIDHQTGAWNHQQISYNTEAEYFFWGLMMDNSNDVLYSYVSFHIYDLDEVEESGMKLVTINPNNGIVTEVGEIENAFMPQPAYSEYTSNVFASDKIYTIGNMLAEDLEVDINIYIVDPADATYEQIDLGESAIMAALFKDELNENLYVLTAPLEEESFEFIIHSIDKETNTLQELFRLPYDSDEEHLYHFERVTFNSYTKNLVIFGVYDDHFRRGYTINLTNQNYVVAEADLEILSEDGIGDFIHWNCSDDQTSITTTKKEIALRYNNPAIGTLHVISEELKSGKITIYNGLMQLVQKALLNNGEAIIEINTLPEGLYYFQVTGENSSTSSGINKLVITK